MKSKDGKDPPQLGPSERACVDHWIAKEVLSRVYNLSASNISDNKKRKTANKNYERNHKILMN
jgi:hypothetical protein